MASDIGSIRAGKKEESSAATTKKAKEITGIFRIVMRGPAGEIVNTGTYRILDMPARCITLAPGTRQGRP
jgi:hypothetical protein